MSLTPVRADEARRTETPNAVMTTLVSPTQGDSSGLALWRVDMEAGQQGPVHRFDTEQAWHLTEGRAEIAADGTAIALGPGDSVVVPAGVTRQVTALTRVRFVVCGDGRGVAWVPGEDQSRGTPPWIG